MGQVSVALEKRFAPRSSRVTQGVWWLIPPLCRNVPSSGYVIRMVVHCTGTAANRTDQFCPLRVHLLEREADKSKVNKIKITIKDMEKQGLESGGPH